MAIAFVDKAIAFLVKFSRYLIMEKNYEPCFYNLSNDWRERWSLIREFTTKWYGIQFRVREELLPLVKQEEAKLGFELPPSIREYIMFSADANGIRNNKTVKVIRDDYKVEYFKELSAISLLILSEGDCFWGVKKSNLTQEDPPVESYHLKNKNLYGYSIDKSRFFKKEEFSLNNTEYATTITSFVLQQIVFILDGYFKTGYYPFTSIRDMNKFFNRKVLFGNMLIYDKQNIIAVFSFDKKAKHKSMFTLRKPIEEKDIPKFILDDMNDESMQPF